ncbi:uncharacterized protein LOC119786109 [Cyprinodon tularosa]|uniref:uncharacterized protein LOC119786109 n=1 Tax=Cyprinodon tularosa TaxID=77115 RepID=UPI0018E1F0CC|nr:uncharacterized protein LOC119786109 [Cyprinodon tularosa]
MMASSSPSTSFHGDSSSSSPEPTSKRPKRQTSTRGGPRGSDRGGRGRGRGRGRAGTAGGRPRGRRPQPWGLELTQEDFERIRDMRADRIANEDARIQSLDLQQAREILRGALTRDPSLMFDLAHRTSGPPGPQPQPPAAQPTWCVCTNGEFGQKCGQRLMLLDLEKATEDSGMQPTDSLWCGSMGHWVTAGVSLYPVAAYGGSVTVILIHWASIEGL